MGPRVKKWKSEGGGECYQVCMGPPPSRQVAGGGRPREPQQGLYIALTAKVGNLGQELEATVIKILKQTLPRPLGKVAEERQTSLSPRGKASEFSQS